MNLELQILLISIMAVTFVTLVLTATRYFYKYLIIKCLDYKVEHNAQPDALITYHWYIYLGMLLNYYFHNGVSTLLPVILAISLGNIIEDVTVVNLLRPILYWIAGVYTVSFILLDYGIFKKHWINKIEYKPPL